VPTRVKKAKSRKSIHVTRNDDNHSNDCVSKVNLQSSHGVRQTGYGWFHGVSRVICDGYYIVLVVDHPHRWALASRSFFSSRNGTPKVLHSALHRRFLLRRTKVARRHGVPRPRLLPLLHCAPLHSSGGWGDRRPPPTQGTTPAAEAAGVSVPLGVRARQTGATIGSILIGSGRTRGAPPCFEVCDVSIIMMSVDSASQRATAIRRARERERERVGPLRVPERYAGKLSFYPCSVFRHKTVVSVPRHVWCVCLRLSLHRLSAVRCTRTPHQVVSRASRMLFVSFACFLVLFLLRSLAFAARCRRAGNRKCVMHGCC
jgi:hypothetical protein